MFKSKDLLYHSIAILTVIIWGTTFVSTKILINTGLSPLRYCYTVSCLRIFVF